MEDYTEEIKIYYLRDFSDLSNAEFLDQFYELIQKYKNELKDCGINGDNEGTMDLFNKNQEILEKINDELLHKHKSILFACFIIRIIGDYLEIIEKDNISEIYQFFLRNWENDHSVKPISFMNSLKKYYVDNKPLRDKITNIEKVLYKIKYLTFCQ